MKKMSDRKRIVLVMVAILCSILLIVLGGVALYFNYLLGLIGTGGGNSSLGGQTDSWGLVDATGSTSDSTAAETIGNLDEMIHIMLVGMDDRDGATRGHSDTMVLCSVNPKTKKIIMTSFMRDLWVTIPHPQGAYDYKMNQAYFDGGFDLLKETVKFNFGVEIEDFVMVEFASFAAMIDELGGVDITLNEDEADYLNRNYNAGVTAGSNHLTGQIALAYSRIRTSNSQDSDFNRVNRQQNVLNSLFQTYKSKPLLELLSVTEDLLPYLTVTMDKGEIIGYMAKLAPLLSGFQIETQRIPADKTWWFSRIDGKEVIMADLEENRSILAELLKP